MHKLKYVLVAAFLILNASSIKSTEKREHVTPENSTKVYYKVAESSHSNLIKLYDSLNQNVNVPGLDVTPARAKFSVEAAYSVNILGLHMHPGIPEDQWKLRGWVKLGNQEILKEITMVYDQNTDLNGVTIQYGRHNFNPVTDAYISYASGFTPQVTDAEIKEFFADQLTSKYHKLASL